MAAHAPSLEETAPLSELRAEPAVAAPTRPRKRAPLVAGVLSLVAAAVALGVYARGRGHETTDDAQLEGHVAAVQARVSGQVRRVLVTDNQTVRAGDVVVELDDADYRVRVAAAQADLRATRSAQSCSVRSGPIPAGSPSVSASGSISGCREFG